MDEPDALAPCPARSLNCYAARRRYDADAARLLGAVEHALRTTRGLTTGRATRITPTRGGFRATFRVLVFADDVAAAVAPQARGAALTLRSQSRVGRSDLGTNRRRVRRLFEAVERALEG